MSVDAGSIRHADATAECSVVSWDSDAFGFPVVLVDELNLGSRGEAPAVTASILDYIRAAGAGVASCRLRHDRLAESMALEAIGFRFVEFILRPGIDVGARSFDEFLPLRIRPARPDEVEDVAAIAATAFDTSRYAIDPRLPAGPNGRRFAAWVRSAPAHPSQELLVAQDGHDVVGFFITERNEGRVYWHLTAVAPRAQGRGVGRRLWASMMARHAADGVSRIETRISGHNPRVLNLYASLGFGFDAPEMTLHWVAPWVTAEAVTDAVR